MSSCHSNYFLQRVIECGSYQLQRASRSASCMTSWTSPSHVVEACIHLTCSLAPLLLVLNA
jgi:hypothetical protein